MTQINLGDKVKDIITGFSGTVTMRVDHLTGCTQYCVLPKVKAGATNLPDGEFIDEVRIKVTSKAKNPPKYQTPSVVLGTKVKDSITGFEGVATVAAHYINGMIQVTVVPPVDKDGKEGKVGFFDHTRLKTVDKKPLTLPGEKKVTQSPGGSRNEMPSKQYGAR